MTAASVYVKPGRSGLGNMLFPWARAVIFAHQNQLPILKVQWTQPKIGPLLRGERDARLYLGLFNAEGYVRGWRKWIALTRRPRVSEYDSAGVRRVLDRRRGVVLFTGMQGMFEPLLNHRELVREHLLAMLSSRVKAQLSAARGADDRYIGVHVRRGDTVALQYGEPFPSGPGNRGQPIEWFVRAVQSVRQALGGPKPVRIFSDGSDAELAPLLALENVARSLDHPSIVDLLLMARSQVLITTSNSSFSMWAAYLGGMPSVWYAGKGQTLAPDAPGLETDLTGNICDPNALASWMARTNASGVQQL